MLSNARSRMVKNGLNAPQRHWTVKLYAKLSDFDDYKLCSEIQQALRVRQFCTACGVRIQQCLGFVWSVLK